MQVKKSTPSAMILERPANQATPFKVGTRRFNVPSEADDCDSWFLPLVASRAYDVGIGLNRNTSGCKERQPVSAVFPGPVSVGESLKVAP